MDAPILNVISVLNSFRKHFLLIVIVTILSAAGGWLFYVLGPKKFEAKTEFFVRNPLYGDQTIIYNNDIRMGDYFANEEVLDKVLVMARSTLVRDKVITNTNYTVKYRASTDKDMTDVEIANIFDARMKIIRTEYRHVILTFKDTDSLRAINTANEYVSVLDSCFGGFYRETRRNMYESIRIKVHEQDSTIIALTDTLIAIRDRYGIYTSKYNYSITNPNSGNKSIGKGIEQISNIEMLKDAMVADKVAQQTLMNHYMTGLQDQLSMIKVVTPARVSFGSRMKKGIFVGGICGVLALCFTTLMTLISDFIKTNN